MYVSWVKAYDGSFRNRAESACPTADGGYAVLAETASNDRNVSGNHNLRTGFLAHIDAKCGSFSSSI